MKCKATEDSVIKFVIHLASAASNFHKNEF